MSDLEKTSKGTVIYFTFPERSSPLPLGRAYALTVYRAQKTPDENQVADISDRLKMKNCEE